MTPSELATDSQHSLLAVAPALARLRPHRRVGARRGLHSLDTCQLPLRDRTKHAVAVPREIAFASFRLLPAQFLLLEGDRPLRVGSRALEILRVLLERPGELVSKQDLMGRVWPDTFVEPANLTVHISALRHTLRDGRDGNRFIVNVPGRGYSFVASVDVHYESAAGLEQTRMAGGVSARTLIGGNQASVSAGQSTSC